MMNTFSNSFMSNYEKYKFQEGCLFRVFWLQLLENNHVLNLASLLNIMIFKF